jgi:quercetin dioxygenase-like cupin family protein
MTAGFLVRAGEGDAVWSIGGRFTRKVGGADSADRLSILEAIVTRTSEPRRHIHHREDEAFYVLDGQLSFHVGDAVLTAVAGSLAFAPMGIPHTFTVDIEPSRILVITSPSGFEGFVFDLGVPATGDEPPPGLSLPAPEVILPIAERYGIEIVGPTIRDAEAPGT